MSKAADSFIGEALMPSPYEELRAENRELQFALDSSVDQYLELRTKYLELVWENLVLKEEANEC